MTLLCIFLLAAILCFVLLYYTRELTPHEKQQAALKRYHREREREKKRIAAIWKERGKVIRPLDRTRYCDQINEQEPIS